MSVDGIFSAMPDDIYLKDKGKPACLIRALTPTALADWRDTLAGPHLAWMETAHFTAAAGEILLLPDSAGGLEAVLLGLGAMPDPMALAALPKNCRAALIGWMRKRLMRCARWLLWHGLWGLSVQAL